MTSALNDPDLDMQSASSENGGWTEHSFDDSCAVVSPGDELVLPKHRRTVVQYSTDAVGAKVLNLYYGEKEISFDDPGLFPFGETLATQSRFTADSATTWGKGYEWPQIQNLLQQLIDEGILVHAAEADRDIVPVSDGVRPSPLPPSTCPVARSWDECEAITQELAGRPVELGNLELIVPIFRIAHIAVDADQRQVGEANVFPPALRLDVPTEWRTCNLPGSRYQSEQPMNVTAMRVMRAHWSQIMATVLRVRERYLRRYPEADGAWTVGHAERLSNVVLALPTYQLMRQHNRVDNGQLHPVLSSLFRVTDGVRMTMHHMLFVPIHEPTRPPNHAVTVDEILDYAERRQSFHARYGVCAGPRAMVRELIQVLLEGRGNADYALVALDPAVQSALNDLDAAIDYGLHGSRAYAAAFSIWPVMTQAYEQIAEAVDAWPSISTPVITALRKSMRAHRTMLKRTYLAHEEWRANRQHVYADMYRQSGGGMTNPCETPGLDILLAPVWTDASRQAETQLQNILRDHCDVADATTESFVLGLSACIMEFLLRQQAILHVASAVQHHVNLFLGRKQPDRPIGAGDLHVFNLMQGLDPGRLPDLIDELRRLLDIHIHVDMNCLTITRRDAPA